MLPNISKYQTTVINTLQELSHAVLRARMSGLTEWTIVGERKAIAELSRHVDEAKLEVKEGIELGQAYMVGSCDCHCEHRPLAFDVSPLIRNMMLPI